MADRGILFSAPMVRALLAGTKTQTRRVVKKPAALDALAVFGAKFLLLPGNADLLGHAVGDRLWVREAFAMDPAVRRPDRLKNVIYRADVPATEPPASDVLTMDRLMWAGAQELKWKPSIHMPRWASRITLTVTEVRVQRLQDISAADSIAEGVQCETCAAMDQSACNGRGCFASIDAFRTLWSSINGPDAWAANPWVAAYNFAVRLHNIDQVAA